MIGYQCEIPGVCVDFNTNPSELPVKKKGYINFVKWTIDMINEQVALVESHQRDSGFYVGVFGLSGGGPMATYAASRPNNPITRVMVGILYLITVVYSIIKTESILGLGRLLL